MTPMRIYCLDSYANSDQLEQLWLCAEWISALPCSAIRYYIREDRVSLAYLIDSQLVPRPKLDYYM